MAFFAPTFAIADLPVAALATLFPAADVRPRPDVLLRLVLGVAFAVALVVRVFAADMRGLYTHRKTD